MDGLGFTGGLARRAAEHPWTTLGLWVLLIGAALWAATGLGDVLTQEQNVLVETESDRAQALIDEAREAAGIEVALQEFVLVSSDRGARVDDPEVQRSIATLVEQLRATEHVAAVVGPAEGAPVSADGTIGMVQVTLDTTDWTEAANAAEPLVQVVEAADAGGVLDVSTVGSGSVPLFRGCR